MPDNTPQHGHLPLEHYPWGGEITRLLQTSLGQDRRFLPFFFDCILSLAYVDATAGIEQYVEHCTASASGFNAHIGFINLCAPCHHHGHWQYQKAAKPKSGVLGKLSSEVVLAFIAHANPCFEQVLVMGGTGEADAKIVHESGITIFAEVKSAPLLTYPLLLTVTSPLPSLQHDHIALTHSQFKECGSGLSLHRELVVPLGQVGDAGWPFRPFVDFVADAANAPLFEAGLAQWLEAKAAYQNKDKTSPLYYFTNACGAPPLEAKQQGFWPQNEVISDSKTSAGMDRTDDIKKGIYQTLKIGVTHQHVPHHRSALISNLPALRHAEEYVTPFSHVLWAAEAEVQNLGGTPAIPREKLRYLFDYIFTLDVEEGSLRRGLA